MKLTSGPINYLADTKKAMITEFTNPKSESQCIIELKEIKQKVDEHVWEFDQRFKTLIGHLSF